MMLGGKERAQRKIQNNTVQINPSSVGVWLYVCVFVCVCATDHLKDSIQENK